MSYYMSYYYLAIDFGESFVGFSVSNGFSPIPLNVFKYPRGNYKFLRYYLLKLINDFNPVEIVIGIPFSNEDNSLKIKNIFYSSIFLEENLKKKIVWFNEDYSTKQAILLKKRKRMREDSIAASIILENYLYKH